MRARRQPTARSAATPAVTALIVASSLLLGACGGAGAPGSKPSPGALSAGVERAERLPYRWMLSPGALARLAGAGLPAVLLRAYFDRPSTILVGADRPDPLAPRASLAADFTSASALEAALHADRVPADDRYLVLDLEAWPLSPRSEQRRPLQAVAQASAAARAAGRTLVFTPGVDLLRVLQGREPRREALVSAYDRLLAAPGAGAADIFEVQAQGTEATALSDRFASSALRTLRAARRDATVLVGLSTNPDGRKVTAAELLAVVRSVPDASGFWLNVPEAGPACPRCGRADPSVGVQFLEQLVGLGRSAVTSPSAAGSPSGAVSPAPAGSGMLGTSGELLAAGGRPADWILAESHFAQVVGAPGVARLMGGGRVFEPVSARQAPSDLLAVVPTLVAHSETALAAAVSAGQVPTDIGAILYDNERFADTPATEQADPARYDGLVAGLARSHGWTSICDLIEADRLPKGAATPSAEVPPCAIVGLNTVQQSERDPARYAAIVARDVATVHAVDPGVPVLAGLSSNPAGGPVSAGELDADIAATHGLVAGYWLNVPAPGVGCPRCAPPDPAIMVRALEALEASSGG